MPINSIFEFYKTMERNYLISFKGIVTLELVESVLKTSESKLHKIEQSVKTRKKVYSILVECLQNLYHHNDCKENSKEIEDANSNFASILCLSNPENFYEIITGNCISNSNVLNLEKRIKNINSLNKEELRELYKNVLNNNEFSSKGTAGLGLIDIARKSGNKLEFSFIPIDENYSFFCLNVKINQ